MASTTIDAKNLSPIATSVTPLSSKTFNPDGSKVAPSPVVRDLLTSTATETPFTVSPKLDGASTGNHPELNFTPTLHPRPEWLPEED